MLRHSAATQATLGLGLRNDGCVLHMKGRTWRQAGVYFQLEQTGLRVGWMKGGSRVTTSCVSPGASAGAIYEDGKTGQEAGLWD